MKCNDRVTRTIRKHGVLRENKNYDTALIAWEDGTTSIECIHDLDYRDPQPLEVIFALQDAKRKAGR